MSVDSESSKKMQRTIYWFRKGLRLHDNPALLSATRNSTHIWPVFILDPWFVKNYKVGENRWRFLKQSLQNLDDNFKALHGRLYVVRGNPKDVLPQLIEKWNITQLSFEVDTEPYALKRDSEIEDYCKTNKVKVIKEVSHTLFDSDAVISKNGGKPPLTYQRFQTVASQLGPPLKPKDTVSKDQLKSCKFDTQDYADQYNIPSYEELGVKEECLNECLFPGGESEALQRMDKYLKRTNWICTFEKPKTEPNSLLPSTTVLSPYLKFGCLSVRTFYWKLQAIYAQVKKHSGPPVSLHGQLLWREFFYTAGYGTTNFNQITGNSVCRQIKWDSNEVFLNAWSNAATGYPFIDAIMTQLRREGWIHHLARHAVACFLTRGDLWISWEEGQRVFEELLLDADWFLNAGNWMWLSASAFFHQYYRVYSPIAFGKKTDKNGDYIKKYLPQLKKFPPAYIYEPWKAPLNVQKAAGCIIGKDYPKPIVDHDKIRETNIKRMKQAYDSGNAGKEAKKAKGNSTVKRSKLKSESAGSDESLSKRKKTKTIS